ncbi:hypothetical protein MD484_g6725, partial [Candolleomyces efflorescens]
MPFKLPSLSRSRSQHSFHRLRSFYLSPSKTEFGSSITSPTTTESSSDFSKDGWLEHKASDSLTPPLASPTRNRALRGSTLVICAVVLSMFIVSALSLSFLGGGVGEKHFVRTLNSVAVDDPGLVLVGESVDVDVDEPSVTIRWSILACGEGLVLPGSTGILGSRVCGLPVQPLHIFVDSQDTPTASYDPAQIPYTKDNGNRRNIENLVRFDSDHVLDVHSARLYPFDQYRLSSSLRAATTNNETIRISRAITLRITSSFDIETTDLESFVLAPVTRVQSNSTVAGDDTSADAEVQLPSRDIDMHISRPPVAQFFTFLLFGASWILAHISVGLAVLARKRKEPQSLLAYLLSSGFILVGIPQLRSGMPDAPGFDGEFA